MPYPVAQRSHPKCNYHPEQSRPLDPPYASAYDLDLSGPLGERTLHPRKVAGRLFIPIPKCGPTIPPYGRATFFGRNHVVVASSGSLACVYLHGNEMVRATLCPARPHLNCQLYGEPHSPRTTETRNGRSARRILGPWAARMRQRVDVHAEPNPIARPSLRAINRHPARSNFHSGKSLVRSLLRRLPRCARLFGSEHGLSAARSP